MLALAVEIEQQGHLCLIDPMDSKNIVDLYNIMYSYSTCITQQRLTLMLVLLSGTSNKSCRTSSLKRYSSVAQVALVLTFSVTLVAALCCMQTMDWACFGEESGGGKGAR